MPFRRFNRTCTYRYAESIGSKLVEQLVLATAADNVELLDRGWDALVHVINTLLITEGE